MPINSDHVGRVYPATKPYEISRAKIAEFAKALGDDNPAYFGEEPIAPPTFAAIVAARAWDMLFADPELDIALMRTMHGDQGFTYARPLRAGDVVQARLTIEKLRQRAGMDLIGVSVSLTVEDEEVCVASSTLVHNRGASHA